MRNISELLALCTAARRVSKNIKHSYGVKRIIDGCVLYIYPDVAKNIIDINLPYDEGSCIRIRNVQYHSKAASSMLVCDLFYLFEPTDDNAILYIEFDDRRSQTQDVNWNYAYNLDLDIQEDAFFQTSLIIDTNYFGCEIDFEALGKIQKAGEGIPENRAIVVECVSRFASISDTVYNNIMSILEE